MKLSIQDLNSHYGPAHILFDIGLEVGDGEVVALLGRNGAGKSTTFRSIVGLVAQRTGRIVFDGKDVFEILTGHLKDPPPPLSSHRPDLRAFDAAFDRALAKQPGDRHESAIAFIEELTTLLFNFAPVGAALPGLGKMLVKEIPAKPARTIMSFGKEINVKAKPKSQKVVFRFSKDAKDYFRK